MEAQELNKFLSDIEWEEGRIPILNDENRKLQDKVFDIKQEVKNKKKEFEELQERMYSMSQHKKNVDQELQNTQELMLAVSKENETENHLIKVAVGQKERLHQEIIRIEKEKKAINEKINLDENLRFRLGEEIDKLRGDLNVNKTKLEEWLAVTAEKDEDFITFQKYKRLDESKVNELNLQINYLLEEVKNRKNALDFEATETQSVQIALDKTAEEFRRSHLERHELIQLWERSLNLMKKRDDDMESLNNQIHLMKLRVLHRENDIAEKKRFYDNEVENNRQLDEKIQLTNKSASRLRQEYQDKEEQKKQFASELDALKKTVDRTATDLEGSRSQVAELKKETNDATKRNELYSEKYKELEEKLDLVTKSSMSAKEATDQLELLLMKKEKDRDRLEAELRELRSLKYRKEQELKANQLDLKVLEIKTNNSRVAIRNMENKIYKLDQDALKQEALLYTQDLAIDSLNKRIANMEGEVDLDDLNQKKADIKVLTEILEEKNATHKMLEGQLNRLKDDTFKVESEIGRHADELEFLEKKISELKLYNESSDKLLKKKTRDNQELLVKENLEKAEVKRLQKLLYDEAFKVLTQEERKLQIETVKKERKHEIKIHNDMLLSQLKVVETEHQVINMELHERQSKLKKLGTRHELLTSAMAPSVGEEEKSQAYYVIKAAQEKEELQMVGDELDAKIQKAEKENRALDNTIKLLNSSNESYRKSFNRVEDNSAEMEEKKNLEEKLHSVQDELRMKQRQYKELSEDLFTMETTLSHKKQESDSLKDVGNCKKAELSNLEKDLDDIKVKKDRVTRQNIRSSREIRAEQGVTDKTEEELDFELRELKNIVQNNLTELMKVARHHDESVHESLQLYLKEANLPIPSPTGVMFRSSSSSSSSSSGRTSAANVSSRGSSMQKEVKKLAIATVGLDADSRRGLRSVQSTPGKMELQTLLSDESPVRKSSATTMLSSSTSLSSSATSSEKRSRRPLSVRSRSTSSDYLIIGSGQSDLSEQQDEA